MQLTLPIAFLLGSALADPAHAQTLVRSVPGPAVAAQYGKVCIVVPDQNGDAVKDLLVGAPGFNQERGAIYCLSGAFLALGAGTQTLWSLAPTANPGDKFGFAITDVGDVTGDNVHDFLVGQPGYDGPTSTDAGAVRLINGATQTVVSLITGSLANGALGTAIGAYGDADGNGISEIAVGAPGIPGSDGALYRGIAGNQLASSGPIAAIASVTQTGFIGAGLGASIASGFDLDNDGLQEFVVGAPGTNSGGGAVILFKQTTPGNFSLKHYNSFLSGERLGAAVGGGSDYDGDGIGDIVVGAPNSPNGTSYEVGRAVVLSGARLIAQTPPYEIYTFPFGSVTPPVNHTDPEPSFHFGAAVRACPDLNNDGVGEILIGAPDYFTPGTLGGWNFRGLVKLFSGASGTQLCTITGASTDRLGDGLAGAIQDLDGDGFKEFVIAGSRSDVGGTDSGVLKCYRLFPVATSTYCVGKVNSLGCTPAIGFSGTPSASSSAPFVVNATNLVNQKNGLLFYGHAPTAVLFQGGMKCVANPTIRTPPQSSGGSASGSSCTGVYGFDFNAWLQSGADPTLVAGAEVYAQYWSRDPQSPSHTSLSNAVRFLVHP